MPTQTSVDSRKNGGRSPKQADSLDASSSCKAHQTGIQTLLGSGLGIPGGEARSQAFYGEPGLCGYMEG